MNEASLQTAVQGSYRDDGLDEVAAMAAIGNGHAIGDAKEITRDAVHQESLRTSSDHGLQLTRSFESEKEAVKANLEGRLESRRVLEKVDERLDRVTRRLEDKIECMAREAAAGSAAVLAAFGAAQLKAAEKENADLKAEAATAALVKAITDAVKK